MPHESIEAEFVYLPTPSPDQEEHRQLDQEGPLSSPLSHHSTHGAATYVRTGNNIVNIKSLKTEWKIEGYHSVGFEKGKHKDPGDWGKGCKWFVSLSCVFFVTSD